MTDEERRREDEEIRRFFEKMGFEVVIEEVFIDGDIPDAFYRDAEPGTYPGVER
jgi:hypothetical protein